GWSLDFILSAAYHAILPALTLIISTVAGWMLTMRNSMITTLSEDYVLMARAKGLTTRRGMFGYAARNAILPSVTGLAIAIGARVGGRWRVELVFSYQGIVFALFQAIQRGDSSLADATRFLAIAGSVVLTLFVDLVYSFRARRRRRKRSG